MKEALPTAVAAVVLTITGTHEMPQHDIHTGTDKPISTVYDKEFPEEHSLTLPRSTSEDLGDTQPVNNTSTVDTASASTSDVVRGLDFLETSHFIVDPDKSRNTPSDIPWGWITGIASTALLGAGGIRARRGQRIKAIFGEADSDARKASQELALSVRSAQALLSRTTDKDVCGLREAIVSEPLELLLAGTQLSQVYASQKHRLWRPDKAEVENAAEALDIAVVATNQANRTITVRMNKIEEVRAAIRERAKRFERALSAANSRADELTEQGWDLGAWYARFSACSLADTQLAELGTGHDIRNDESQALLDTNESVLYELRADLAGLPERRDAVDGRINQQSDIIETCETIVTTARAAFEKLILNYDASCYEDLDCTPDQLATYLEQLIWLHEQAFELRGTTSVRRLETAGILATAFDNEQQKISNAIEHLDARELHLQEITARIPRLVAGMTKSLEAAHSFITANFEDVEVSTHGQLVALTESLKTLKAHIDLDRPPYIEIEETLNTCRREARELTERAQREQQEMDALRATATRLELEAQANLETLQALGRLHKEIIQGHIDTDPFVPKVHLDLDRKNLRIQVANLGAINNEIIRAKKLIERVVGQAREDVAVRQEVAEQPSHESNTLDELN